MYAMSKTPLFLMLAEPTRTPHLNNSGKAKIMSILRHILTELILVRAHRIMLAITATRDGAVLKTVPSVLPGQAEVLYPVVK